MHQRTALTIGTFDGVHLGHAAIVRACAEHASPPRSPRGAHSNTEPTGRAVVLTLDPHPALTLRPDAAPHRLTSFEQKRELLLAAGATAVVRLTPDAAFLAQSADVFLAGVFSTYKPTLFVEGGDFHFGKDRAGSIETLRAFAQEHACGVTVVPAVQVTLPDRTVHRASSSQLREWIARGAIIEAQAMLGRPYELSGEVVPGDRIGRTLGVPTCNLRTPCLLPADGVYAGRAVLPTGDHVPAAINIGARPTFSGTERRAEVHLILPQGGAGNSTPPHTLEHAETHWSPLPGLSEYGWELRVQVHAFLRAQTKFPDVTALKAQIARDIQRTAAWFRSHSPG